MSKIKKIHPGYATIEKEVLPLLKGFQTDVTTHDKNMLTGYEGDFVIAYRDNGTNLYRLDRIADACNWGKQEHLKSIAINTECAMAFMSNNQHFLFVDKDGKSKEITEGDAVLCIEKREEEAIKIAKFFKDIDLHQVAFELMTFIKYNGRSWKSRLNAEWESNSSTPALTRLRNHFSHAAVFNQKAILAFDDEEVIFSKLASSYAEGQ